jgi:hypothetical protein
VKFHVLVLDERTGKPLEGALVESGFVQNFGDQPTIGLKFQSPTNGLVLFEGETSRAPNIALSKPGYYPVIYQPLNVPVQRTATRWEPWGATNVVVLRPVIKPVPMRIVAMNDMHLPKVGHKVGYDIVAEDWVSPHGRGLRSDLEFEAQGFYKSHTDHESTLVLRMPNPGDGVIVVGTNQFSRSELRLPRHAPEDGYTNEIAWHFKGVLGADGFRQDTEPDYVDGFVFRFRTVLDEKGNVRSARYAKMLMVKPVQFGGAVDGAFLLLGKLYVNPTLNDRNLEDSRQQFIDAGGNPSDF